MTKDSLVMELNTDGYHLVEQLAKVVYVFVFIRQPTKDGRPILPMKAVLQLRSRVMQTRKQ